MAAEEHARRIRAAEEAAARTEAEFVAANEAAADAADRIMSLSSDLDAARAALRAARVRAEEHEAWGKKMEEKDSLLEAQEKR